MNNDLKTQIWAVTPVWLMMICGGMYTGYGILNVLLGYQHWASELSSPELFIASASFHFTLALGAIISSTLYYKYDTWKLNIFNTILTLIASIILVILPDTFASVVTSRTLFGLGFGSIYITSIIYASEISSAKFRAKAIFTLHLLLTLGMLFFSALCMTLNIHLILRATGAICALFSVTSSALGYYTMKSSHIFMMENNLENVMQRFKFFRRDSTDINNNVEIETMQSYMIEEKKRKFNYFSYHNISALAVVMLAKLGYLSISNALYNTHRSLFLSVSLTVGDINYTEMTMMTTRLLGCIAGFIVLDQISKRLQFLISSLIISSLLFSFGALFITNQLKMIWTPLIFLIPMEFLLGLGIGGMDDILKAELFPLKEKPLSIATTIVLEQCIQIVCIIILYSWIFSLGSVPSTMTFIVGAITLLCGFALFLLLRDSRQQSLVQVSNLYSNK